MSTSKQILVVFGATGKQGGSVINSIVNDAAASARFHVKGVTRDVNKESAKALATKGVEVVAADLNDKDSLRAVIKGAYAVFSITNFWEYFNMEIEVKQGKNVADVSKEEGVQHLIWSSLLSVNKHTSGKLSKVYHFDGKAEVEEYIRALGIPATFFLAGAYMSDYPGSLLRQMPDGKWGLALPVPADAQFPLIDIEHDTGKFVKAILLKREEVLGRQIYASAAYYTPQQMVDHLKKLYPEAGEGAAYHELPHDAFKGILAKQGMPEVVQEELLQNLIFIAEYGYYGGESLDESIAIVDEPLTSWEQYLQNHPICADLK
ncbi:hypothetical protein BD626DRAFT_631771 [Schizophyllum amplum]|uniref:NmrA-like family domain-containing protein 1 n=1 Tax=Schizophyllum amplum TaxID=97359 RepID=A0A550C8W6_9AGAR|nr:hypothetical protein BD626DRAFT_631771 [Auriculariopsis ampla]